MSNFTYIGLQAPLEALRLTLYATVSFARCLFHTRILPLRRHSGLTVDLQIGAKMKLSASRSSILTALVITAVLAALPAAIRRLLRTGDPYLLTRDFFEDVVARLSGAGRLRFILQPTIALLLGRRDGIRDSQSGRPPLLSGLLFHRMHRPGLLRSTFASIRDLVAIAIILDMVAQFLIFREIHPGAALLVGPVLVALPYCISRDLTNRSARGGAQQNPIIHTN